MQELQSIIDEAQANRGETGGVLGPALNDSGEGREN